MVHPLLRHTTRATRAAACGTVASHFKVFGASLHENVFYDLTVNISQTKVASGVTIRKPLVVDAELMKNCCVQIVDGHAVLDGFEPKLVRSAVCESTFNATARHPHRVSV